MAYTLDSDVVMNLDRTEQATLLPRKQQVVFKQGEQKQFGLQRLRNLAVKDKIDKFFMSPAVYMQPHKNALADIEMRKN